MIQDKTHIVDVVLVYAMKDNAKTGENDTFFDPITTSFAVDNRRGTGELILVGRLT